MAGMSAQPETGPIPTWSRSFRGSLGRLGQQARERQEGVVDER